MHFSVLMSIYEKENPFFLKSSLDSVFNQSVLPSEVVLMKDGPLTKDLEKVISEYIVRYNQLKVVSLEFNMGLGEALRIGIYHCSNELIARMDTDDICYPNRFAVQLAFMAARSDIAVVGSNVEEFNQIPGDLKSYRKLPEKGTELLKYSKYRSPVNHPSIMFRKSAVIDCGNYDGSIRLFEDYSLFIKMLLKGYKFYNIQQVLLYFRVGDGIENIKRRSGIHYIKSELRFFRYARSIGYLNLREYIISIVIKTPIRLLPTHIIKLIYSNLLRKT